MKTQITHLLHIVINVWHKVHCSRLFHHLAQIKEMMHAWILRKSRNSQILFIYICAWRYLRVIILFIVWWGDSVIDGNDIKISITPKLYLGCMIFTTIIYGLQHVFLRPTWNSSELWPQHGTSITLKLRPKRLSTIKIFLHNQVIYGNNAGDSFYGPRMQNLNFIAGMIRRRSGKGIVETAEYYSTPTMQTLLFTSTHSTSYSTRIRTRQHGIHTCIQQKKFPCHNPHNSNIAF